jgi:hypothetical protein
MDNENSSTDNGDYAKELNTGISFTDNHTTTFSTRIVTFQSYNNSISNYDDSLDRKRALKRLSSVQLNKARNEFLDRRFKSSKHSRRYE